MTQAELKQRFEEAFLEVVKTRNLENGFVNSRFLPSMELFLRKPLCIFDYLDFLCKDEYQFAASEDHAYSEETTEKVKKMSGFLPKNTMYNIIKYLNDNNIPHLVYNFFSNIYVITEDIAMFGIGNWDDDPFSRNSGITFISEKFEVPKWFEDSMEFRHKEKENDYRYVVHAQNGFTTRSFEIKTMDNSLEENYNDDLPNTEVENFINSDDAGVMIFHGEPGTGKTTYIRNLISKFKDKEFLYLDASCFNYITDASFIKLLMDYRDSVLILEDSEKLLKKRENSQANMSTLLNMTDGILADSMKLKIICTFNASIEDIDKALMRKGRLKVKYNFGKLKEDKVAKLLDKLGIKDVKVEPMTLADIYNYKEQVDFSTKEKRSVGF